MPWWSSPHFHSFLRAKNLGSTLTGIERPRLTSYDSFFDAVDRLYDPSYIPDDADILRCRVKSTGITETTFHIGTLTYRQVHSLI